MRTLDRREFTQRALSTLALGAWTMSAPAAWAATQTGAVTVSNAASKLYRRAIVIDGCGAPGGFVADADDGAPLSAAMIADVKNSGVTAINMTVGAIGNDNTLFEDTMTGIAFAEREIQSNPTALMKILRYSDLEAAKDSGRLGLILGFQDGSMLGADLDRLDMFYRLGVRIIQPTYNGRNLIGDGCLEPGNAGLSRFGRQVIERMNSLGILLDLSHCGQRTTAEGIEASKVPMAITHSGCRALVDIPRNKRDDELRAMADKGGVVGIYFMPFLRASGQPTSTDAILHIEHAINVCGEDHVGIGTDGLLSAIEVNDAYKNAHLADVEQRRKLGISAPGESAEIYNFLPDLNTPRRFETLADMLLARGHSAPRVEKILGGNFARVFREAWKG
jgi:membrane dipeptidase